MLSGFRFNINRGIRVGGIMTIYHCVVIHSALELGGYGGKVTIYLRNGKGKKKINIKW